MPAWMKRKILSTSRKTSCCTSSRKYSAMVSAACPTRNRAPGGSFIWPNTMMVLSSTPACFHFTVELLPLPAALADAAKQTDPFMLTDHIVDHLHNQNGFTHPGTAEKTAFAPSFQGREYIDNLDSGMKNLGGRRLAIERHRLAVNRAPLTPRNGFAVVDRFAENVEYPAQQSFADGHRQGLACVDNPGALSQTPGGCQGDSPHGFRIQMRNHLDQHVLVFSGFKDMINFRQMLRETGVDDAAAHGKHRALIGLMVCIHRFNFQTFFGIYSML